MTQVFANKENIGALTKFSNAVVQLAPSVITIGARQYTTGILNCDTGVSGVGGLDTGSIAADTVYNVYAVVESGNVVLICSLSKDAPAGYSISTKIGGMSLDISSDILEVSNNIQSGGNVFFKVPIVKYITALGAGVYNTPTNVSHLRIRMVGGGGGGGGQSNNGSNFNYVGNTGTNTTFGDMVANAGAGGNGVVGAGGAGGGGTLGIEAKGYIHNGGGGRQSTGHGVQAGSSPGAGGGESMLSGSTRATGVSATGLAGTVNSGAGGSGGGGINHTGYDYGAAGGGGGGGIDATINNPASSYAYSVGDGGNGAGGSNYAGGKGGSGVIIIEEFYQ